MIRILSVTHTAEMGGAEIALLRLLEASTKTENEVIVFGDGDLVTELRKVSIQTHVFPFSKLGVTAKRNKLSEQLFAIPVFILDSIKLRRKIKSMRFDIIHANTVKAGIAVLIATFNRKTIRFFHIRDYWSGDYFPGYIKWFLKKSFNFYHVKIANSQSTKNASSLSNVKVLASPIKVCSCRAKNKFSMEEEIKLVMIGRIAPWKGQSFILDVIAKLPSRYNIKIIGSPLFGEDEYLKFLIQKAQMLRIQPRVSFIPHQKSTCSHLTSSDIAIHASLKVEPFGMVIPEAMFHGIPVVAASGGGPSEIIDNGKSGILATAGNIKEYVDAITSLEDSSLYERISREGRVQSFNFQAETIAEEFSLICNSALSKRKI